MEPVFNIAAYCFAHLPDAPEMQPGLLHTARSLGLKGTILLAEEGINLALAGTPQAIAEIVGTLRDDSRLADMDIKESWSAAQPFRRLRVKVKTEIIRMNQPAIRPAAGRAPAVDPLTLKRWLDQGHDDTGRPVVTLDTRNGFEVDHGAFDNCLDWRLEKFSDFPQELARHRDELTGKTVVSYCTGGIRCEKAAIALQDAGTADVYQLDGGILRYFERAGAHHFRGRCFVFDERVALAPDQDADAASAARRQRCITE